MKLINKKISSLILGTTISLTSITYFATSLNNNFITNNLQASNFNGSTAIEKNAIANNKETITTKDGFITLDNANKTINLISYFGNVVWSYDLKTSGFLKVVNNNQAFTINSFYVQYNPTVNRIIVVGQVNSNQGFFFQLEASSGQPFFANNDPSIDLTKKYSENVIYTSKDKFTNNPKIISFVNQTTAVVFSDNNVLEQQNIFKINLSSNIYTTITLDPNISALVSNSKLNVLAFKNISSDVNLLITRKYNTNINDGSSLELFVLNSNLAIYTSLVTQNSTISYAYQSFNNFSEGSLTGSDLLNKVVFEPQVISKTSSNVQIYLPVVGVKGLYLLNFTINRNTISDKISPYTFFNTFQYIKPVNGREFIVSDFTYDEKGTLYFTNSVSSSLIETVHKLDLNSYISSSTSSAINLSSDAKLKGSSIIKIVNASNTSSTTNFVFANKQNIFKSNTKTFLGGSIVNNNNNLTIRDINIPNVSSPHDEATNAKLFYKLPTDISDDNLISLLTISNYNTNDYSVTLTNYPGTTSSNKKIANSNNGTLKFSLKLSIKKWWETNQNLDFIYNYDWNGFQTFDKLKFNLVSNASISDAKFDQVTNLMKTKFPNEITKTNILNYFIDFGSSLNITENDISMNEQNSNKQIKVTTNQNAGSIKIDYTIEQNKNSTTLPESSKSGSYTWNGFKAMKDWQELSIQESLFNAIKRDKYASQIRVNDLIGSLRVSKGFSLDPSNWKWEPDFSNTNNKLKYIQNNINGIVTGKLSYIPRTNIDPSLENLPNKGIIDIKQGSQDSQGAKNLLAYFGDNTSKNNAFIFNTNIANQLAASLTTKDFINQLPDIIRTSSTIPNNWISASELGYRIVDQKDTQVTIDIFVPDNAKTNLELEPNTNLILDNDWKQELIKTPSQKHLYDAQRFTITTNLAQFKWNYGISEDQVQVDASTIGKEGEKIVSMLPSKYISTLPKDPTKGYIEFQNLTNLISAPLTRNTQQFTITRIDLVPNDSTGELLVNYYLDFNNIVPNQVIKKTGSILLTNTRSIWQIIIFWILIIIAISLIVITTFIIASTIRKNQKKKKLFSTADFRKKYRDLKK